MILVDASEIREGTRLPDIQGARKSTILEAFTGADFMISPIDIPATTEQLLTTHIKSGALLVQRKSGSDLPASITGRLYRSLARMRATGAAQWQCVLLTTGWYMPDTKTGLVMIVTPEFKENGAVTFHTEQYSKMNYKAVQSARRHWTWMGGVPITLVCDDEIPGWCHASENQLKEKKKMGKIRYIWPDGSDKFYDLPEPLDPFQEPVEVTDWRCAMVAGFKGIGPTLVRNLQKYMQDNGIADTMLQAMALASSGLVRDVPGWGKGKQNAVRRALGLDDASYISIARTDWTPLDVSELYPITLEFPQDMKMPVVAGQWEKTGGKLRVTFHNREQLLACLFVMGDTEMLKQVMERLDEKEKS